MRPRRLQLRNFLSYGEKVPPLSFEGLRLVCLSGPNGHGKSALLDAITWALWGKARARSDDDLIRYGAQECLVDFEFELEGLRYRVRRERVRRGSRGLTRLDFFVWDAEKQDWRPLTESTLRDTQARIVETLKVDYETFITSAYLRQGQADRFATMRPAERKAVLAEILRLDQYARWEERAKEKARDVDARLTALAHQVAMAKEEIAREGEIRAALEKAEARLADVEAELRVAQEKERALSATRERLRQLQEEYQRQQERVRALADEVKTAQAKMTALEGKRGQLQALLARREAIEAEYQEWQRLKEEDALWNEKLRAHAALEAELRRLQQAYDQARHKLEQEIARLEQEIGTLRAEVAPEPEVRQQLMEAEAQLEQLKESESALQAAQEKAAALQEKRAELRAELSRLKQEMQELKERLDRLEAARGEPACPLCGQPLTEAHVQEMVESIRQEGRAKKAQFTDLKAQLEVVEAEVRQVQDEVETLRRRLTQRSLWERRHAQAEAALRRIEEAQRRLEAAEQKLESLQRQLREEAFAAELVAQLRAAKEQLEAIGYDETAHEAVRQRLQALAPAEERYRELERGVDQLAETEQQLAQLKEDIARWSERLQQEKAALAEKEAQLRELPDVEAAWRQQTVEVERLSAEVARARTEVGALRQQLAAIEHQKARLQEWETQRKALERERRIYRELAEAFGKRGLQAMIIEAVLPELEEEANRLLARMTDGRMSVRLRTQRAKASGEGVIETLDIEIADELGARPYEMFSGGEALRINFALRIALSKLLAQRAGARLRTLFIDEGFGSQDAEGRVRLVDAINAIQDEFDLILVITHIEELKDMFPARIEVFKGPQGSYFTLT